MTNTIAVGIDGSPSSAHALRWALDHARERGGRVRAITAWTPPPTSFSPGLPTVTPSSPREAAESVLDQVLASVVDGADASRVDKEVVEGPPAKVLIEHSKDVDLLVVGSRGIGGFAGLLLGSVSQQVSQHASCPVVVMRDGTAPA